MVQSIGIGDEIGNTRIVWLTSFYDKDNQRVILFITIDNQATYRLFRADSSKTLYKTKVKSPRLKNIILECLEITRTECRLKHKPWKPRKY